MYDYSKLQNAQLDSFINESLNTLAYKELETSKFVIRQFQESFLSPSDCSAATNDNVKFAKSDSESNSDIFYSNNNSCFNNLIQYDIQPHDKTLNKVANKKNLLQIYLNNIKCNLSEIVLRFHISKGEYQIFMQ